MSARTVLVTGGAGFIGSHLCEALVARGHRVRVLDNLSSGRLDNLRALQGHPAFALTEGDVLDEGAVRQAVQGCDAVVHLAAQVSVPGSLAAPEQCHAVNGTGFLSVLLRAGEAGVRRFVYASSSAVYGNCQTMPLSETAPTAPLSPYAATKLLNEHYAACLSGRFPGMAAVGLRFFNIFGSRQPAEGGYAAVIPRWLTARLGGQAPVLFGDGSATRDYCHVDNVSSAIAALVEQPGAAGARVYNIGCGIATGMGELDGLIRRLLTELAPALLQRPLDIQPPRPGDIVHSVACIKAARDEMGFAPAIALEAGLRAMVAEGLKSVNA